MYKCNVRADSLSTESADCKTMRVWWIQRSTDSNHSSRQDIAKIEIKIAGVSYVHGNGNRCKHSWNMSVHVHV